MDQRPPWSALLFVSAGSALAGLGVVLGALGSHVFEPAMTDRDFLKVFQPSVTFQLVHGVALIAVGMLARVLVRTRPTVLAGWLILIGTLLFCGSLYGIAVLNARWLGALAPFGGSSLIAGWACLFFATHGGWKSDTADAPEVSSTP